MFAHADNNSSTEISDISSYKPITDNLKTLATLGPRLISVPDHMAQATKPKVVDFTEVDLYPSKYKYVDGKVIVKSLVIEDIKRQHEVLKKMNTTVMIGDSIKIDITYWGSKRKDKI